MIVLDTDIISLLDAESGETYERLKSRLSAAAVDRVCVTIISVEEQMRGWLAYIAVSRALPRQIVAYERLQRMLHWYGQQEVLPFDSNAAGIFERLKQPRTRIGTMDLKIAAIAIANDAMLVSRNLSDFNRVAGLTVEDWTR